MKYTYKTDFRSSFRIERLEVVKETKATITVLEKDLFQHKDHEHKYVKASERAFHDTWADAKSTLVEQAERKVQWARRQLELAQSVLGNIKGMKEPQ